MQIASQLSGTTWTFGTTWTRDLSRRLLATCVAGLLAVLLAAPVSARGSAANEFVDVVVQRATTAAGAAEQAVVAVGGHVGDRLDIVEGFAARVPANAVEVLEQAPAILSVAPDRPIEFFSRRMDAEALRGAGTLDHIREVTGAEAADWFGVDGSDVGVAVLDTGVTSVPGLNGSGKLLHGPDITSEAGTPAATTDGYGHGTHLAGIVAGNDGNSGFDGVADDAQVVSVKAAPRDGSTSLLQVLAALDWIVEHKNESGIRVLNLSLGIQGTGDYRSDPLAVAVERVWKAGIVVVVAAGNDGEQAGSPITSPATDPYVIAVGAADTKGTTSVADDIVPGFSPRGSNARRVDVVAPGQSVVSLRVPGSQADVNYPTARVGDRFFKGTGTSQAAAVVSGVVADLLEARPTLTPDQVKAILKSTATDLPSANQNAQGAGMVNVMRAAFAPTPRNATQTWDSAFVPPAPTPAPPAPDPAAPAPPCPTGSEAEIELEAALAAGCDTLEASGGSWSGGSWSGGSWSGGSWSGGSWSGGSWSGSWTEDSWSGGSWSGGSWSGGSWSGGSWSGGSWSGDAWAGGSWSGGSWSGGSWSGGSWSGGSWSGGSWSGGSWSGGSWSGGSWSGGSWSGGSWSGGSWSGGSWSGGSWSGGSWSGGSWSGGSWSGGSWSGGSWSGGSWSGGSWSGGSWSGGSWSGGSWSGGSWSGSWT